MAQPEIDFVLPWVDGNDPVWQSEKEKHHAMPLSDERDIRYRDWNLLQYWFRGVEKFAPWVRRIHLITYGHLPPWLNTEHPKLHIVNHQDYLPPEALPTFSSHPIELNMHRIEGLASHFVYFNDDMFLTKPTPPTIYFLNGLPRDDAILSPIIVTDYPNDVGFVAANCVGIINKHFNKAHVIGQSPAKWFSPRYGAQLLRTLCLISWRHFPGFLNDHMPQAFLKETFMHVWDAEPQLLTDVTTHRYRDYGNDVSQWLMRYWQLCENNFIPISPKRGMHLEIYDTNTPSVIRAMEYHMVCLNDSQGIKSFESAQHTLDEAFSSILPEVSSFERYS
jgi:hypothetical protein